MIRTTGTVLMGRHTYQFAPEDGQFEAAYGGLHVPHIVLTHHVPTNIPEKFPITFITDGITRAVALAKDAAGEKNVSVLGANVAQQCLRAGLKDTIQLHLVPVLIGSGVRLFQHVETDTFTLERAEVVDSPLATNIRYRVILRAR